MLRLNILVETLVVQRRIEFTFYKSTLKRKKNICIEILQTVHSLQPKNIFMERKIRYINKIMLLCYKNTKDNEVFRE